MACRGDATDPLEIIIQRHRGMRRIALLILVVWIVPMLWRIDLSMISSLSPEPYQPIAALSPQMSAHGPKMSAQALERLIRSAPVSNRAPHDVRCTPGQNGWDYVCTYQTYLPYPQSQLRIGVRVSSNEILQASAPSQLNMPLPSP